MRTKEQHFDYAIANYQAAISNLEHRVYVLESALNKAEDWMRGADHKFNCPRGRDDYDCTCGRDDALEEAEKALEGK